MHSQYTSGYIWQKGKAESRLVDSITPHYSICAKAKQKNTSIGLSKWVLQSSQSEETADAKELPNQALLLRLVVISVISKCVPL